MWCARYCWRWGFDDAGVWGWEWGGNGNGALVELDGVEVGQRRRGLKRRRMELDARREIFDGGVDFVGLSFPYK